MVQIWTMAIAVLLVALGAIGWLPHRAGTALIPAAFGVAIFVLALIARRGDRARKHAMHGAAMLALAGFAMSAGVAIRNAVGGGFTSSLSAACQIGMAALTGLLLGICVRSFIAAGRARRAGTARD